MIFRPILVLLIAAEVSCNISGQAVIKGRVYDRKTQEPLIAVNISYEPNRGAVSGKNGYFVISANPGIVNLTFRYVGYHSVSHLIRASSGDTLFVEVPMDIEISEIDQIVVSAGKVEQPVSELTVSMNVIRPDLINSTHVTDPTELLNHTPGIEVMDGQASIRGGSGFSYGAGSRVLVLIDGLPVLAADAGNIKWQFLPLENISQVEIIKGASSVLYGSSALNGVINFRTKEASTEPETRFYIEAGVFGKPKNRNWIWWDTPRTFYSACFSHLRKEGNTDISTALYLQNDNGYRKYNDEKLGRINLVLKHNHRKIEGLTYGINLNAGINQKTDFILWENAQTGALKQDTSTASLLNGYLVTVDPFISFTRGSRSRHDLRTRFQTSENRFPDGGQNNSRAISFLADYRFRYSIFNWMYLSLGGYENFSRIFSAFYGDHHSLNLSGYTQAEILPAERIKLVGGFRFEYYNLDGEDAGIVPLFRAGVNYRLKDYTFLRASFGQGYRFPSIAEKFASTTLGSVSIVPNPEVKSESGWSSEAGIKQGILAGNLNGFLDLAIFFSQNSDMIEYTFGIYPDPNGTNFIYGFKSTNIENSRVLGTEISFSLSRSGNQLSQNLQGGYTFMYPVEFNTPGNESVTYLKYRRKHSFKFNYSINYRKLASGFNLSLASKILNIDNVFLNELTREQLLPGFYDYWADSNKGFILVDPYIGITIWNNYKLSFAVKNFLNVEYMGRPGDIMPQRHFSLRFSGEF